MTNLTNYHSHCLYCDGRANMEDFIRFAISEGFSSYGISSHAPLPFSTAWTMEWDRMDDYLSEFSRLKEKYADNSIYGMYNRTENYQSDCSYISQIKAFKDNVSIKSCL